MANSNKNYFNKTQKKIGYTTDSIPAPIDALEDHEAKTALNKWKEQDKKTLTEIILSVSKVEMRSISICETSKKAWKKVQLIHALKDLV